MFGHNNKSDEILEEIDSVCDEIDNKTPFLTRVMSKKAVIECNVENKDEIMDEEDIKTAITGKCANSPFWRFLEDLWKKFKMKRMIVMKVK